MHYKKISYKVGYLFEMLTFDGNQKFNLETDRTISNPYSPGSFFTRFSFAKNEIIANPGFQKLCLQCRLTFSKPYI